MEFNLIFISFTLLFFSCAHAICVTRNNSTSSPNLHAPPNVKPAQPGSASQSQSLPTPQNSPIPASTPSTGKPLDAKSLINSVVSTLPRASGNENPEIKKICESTDFPDICLATLGRYNGPADFRSVLGIAIQAGLDFSKAALDIADKLASQTGMPTDQASSLKDCKDSYDDVQYNFQNANDALSGKDVGTMNTMLSAAITDIGDCQDVFQGMDCPLAPFSDKLTKMASNCLAIISLMNK